MPTTIERSRSRAATAGAVVLALAGWIAVLAAAAYAAGSGTVVALGPPARMIAGASGAGAELVSAGHGYLSVRPNGRDGVAALYASGAWLVLPTPGAGCVGRR